ncbi:hypothetical protein [Treponema pectinovorum]|uniref:hypothetical protein n=1 Tax=Treponema pectinovorum TaxID=164 RepID=UPI0011C87957|nr:hypothetical protein [Treponema pectinovorum]
MTKINTYNETSLHKTLKQMYAKSSNGKTEQKIGNFICDIVAKSEGVIEIQTSNISSLRKKIEFILASDTNIKIVHPVIRNKIIETYSRDGVLLTRRKSPKKESIYSMLRQLTGIYDLLTKNRFSLEVLEVTATEIRIKFDQKMQTQNKSRRHLKDWISKEKKLDFIHSKKTFRTKDDYLSLLPQTLSKIFTLVNLKNEILKIDFGEDFTKANRQDAANKCKLLLWLLEKMEIVKRTGKKDGRSILYQINLTNS